MANTWKDTNLTRCHFDTTVLTQTIFSQRSHNDKDEIMNSCGLIKSRIQFRTTPSGTNQASFVFACALSSPLHAHGADEILSGGTLRLPTMLIRSRDLYVVRTVACGRGQQATEDVQAISVPSWVGVCDSTTHKLGRNQATIAGVNGTR